MNLQANCGIDLFSGEGKSAHLDRKKDPCGKIRQGLCLWESADLLCLLHKSYLLYLLESLNIQFIKSEMSPRVMGM